MTCKRRRLNRILQKAFALVAFWLVSAPLIIVMTKIGQVYFLFLGTPTLLLIIALSVIIIRDRTE